MLRQNKLKGLLSQGGIAFGAGSQIASPALVEVMGLAGYDFVIIDTEHGMFDIDTAGDLIRAAHGIGMTPIVRVLRNEKELIMKALDLGAYGVIIPHVKSKEDALKAIDSARYGPVGHRGSCPVVSAADFTFFEWKHYQEWANGDTIVFLLIEDKEGVEKIEEILSVDGVDAIFLGPFDLSVGMGLKGDSAHPDVQKALDKVLAACKARKIPAMYAIMYPTDLEKWIAKGVRLFVHASDVQVFAEASNAFLKSISHLRKGIIQERTT